MITPIAQRWTERRSSYRPAGETFDPRRFEVAPITRDAEAKAFVVRHHYSGSYPAARRRMGLYQLGELVGVAVFSVPANPRALECLPGTDASRAELGRFVLVDSVRANGESWFIARCFELLRADGFTGVVAFSDPARRLDAAGALVFRGHVGTIYQATNATYLGRSRPESRRLLPDGSLLHGRALAKIRARDRGWRYAAAQLEACGAEPLEEGADSREWVARWVARLTRPLQHPGNHKYAWALERRGQRLLAPSLPYPKLAEAA